MKGHLTEMSSHTPSSRRELLRAALGFGGALALGCSAPAAEQQDGGNKAGGSLPPGGTPVLAPDTLLTRTVGGLENTKAAAEVVPVQGQPFAKALRVTIGAPSAETNATQLTIPNAAPIRKGDALLAAFSVRGEGAQGGGNTAARVEFLFEKATTPWTKSVTHPATAPRDRGRWRRVFVPFVAAEDYAPGEAMASLRLAFGKQTVEVGGLEVVNYGMSRTADELVVLAAEQNPLGAVTVAVDLATTKQTLGGFGGNFCQPRYGSTEAMDPVGRYNLEGLKVVQARIGIPLNHWTPEQGVYKDEGQAKAALEQMRMMAERKIPILASVWEGPLWMLGGRPEQNGRTLPPERYDICIEAIGRFLVTARDKYAAHADYFSFNEPDYGVNFKFTPEQMGAFIKKAGPRWAALGLKTKFLTADTANGGNFAAYARPLLDDKEVAPYLGPLAFHCWDALSAPEANYTAIAALGRQYNKPIWCTEAGHDAQLWRQPNPWASWNNALRTALAYTRTLHLSGAAVMDYWTYQDNYPLVSKDGRTPYPVWHVVKQMEEALPVGAKIASVASSSHDDLTVLPTAGPKAGQFSVLLVNPSGAGRVTLSGLTPNASVAVLRSTADGQAQRVSAAPRVDRTGRVSVAVPARSVVTILGGHA